MRFLSLLIIPTTLFVSSVALADVAPFCDQFKDLMDCSKADVGKACPEGGTCSEVYCDNGGASSVFKCTTCNLIPIPDPDGICQNGPSAYGKACGNGGNCTKFPSWCKDAGTFACAREGVGESGTGGATGEAGNSGQGEAGDSGQGTAGSVAAGGSEQQGSSRPASDDDSGCSVSGAGRHGALAGLMLALGAAALFFERRRR